MFYKFDEMLTDVKEVPEGEPGDLRRLACFGDNLSAMYCDFDKGFSWTTHSHVHEQMTICIYGAIEYTIDGETQVMQAGDTAYLPSGVPHSAVCLEDTRIIDIFTPVRMDQMAFFDKSIKAESAFLKDTND